MTHPDMLLAALVTDELSDAQRRTVEAHLTGCARCRALRERLVDASVALAIPEPRLGVPAFSATRPRVSAAYGAPLALVAALLLGVALGAFARVQSSERPPFAASATGMSGSPTAFPSPTPSVSGQPSATASASLTPTPSSSAGAPAVSSCNVSRDGASGSVVQVCPGSGTVGARVVLEGNGCHYPDAHPTIVFGTSYDASGAPEGGVGWTQLPPITPAADGSFRVEFTIPAELGPRQLAPGGPTTPGRYQFFSKPAGLCTVPFTVVAR